MKNVKLLSLFALLTSSTIFAVPNLASINCELLQGQLEIRETEMGQDGFCHVDAWHLLIEMSERNLVLPIVCESPNDACMPNPAYKNCEDINGKIAEENNKTTCVVSEWDLFRVIDITDEQ